MNIFVTHNQPYYTAIEHCDVHLRKMIVETAQLLATAHFELDGEVVCYKPTHKNHPCAKWVREDYKNYRWASALLWHLCGEYDFRFKKTHKTEEHLKKLINVPKNITGCRMNSDGRLAPESFVMAMPDQYKSDSVETSYQNYLNDKFKEWRSRERPMKVEWTRRDKPSWVSL